MYINIELLIKLPIYSFMYISTYSKLFIECYKTVSIDVQIVPDLTGGNLYKFAFVSFSFAPINLQALP